MTPISGSPIFPPMKTDQPEASSIRATSSVVVVLPLVPVMATIGRSRKRAASSISPITGTPRAAAATRGGRSWGTPGLSTTASKPVMSMASRFPRAPVSTCAPSSVNEAALSARASETEVSAAVTVAPRRRRNRATASPDTPRPTTRKDRPFTSIPRMAASPPISGSSGC